MAIKIGCQISEQRHSTDDGEVRDVKNKRARRLRENKSRQSHSQLLRVHVVTKPFSDGGFGGIRVSGYAKSVYVRGLSVKVSRFCYNRN